VLTLLDEQARLERMARIIGKDALPPRQRLLLACADLVNESFLRQSAFSPIDRSCSPLRQACMLRLLTHVIELAGRAVDAGAAPEAVLTGALIRPLTRMGEEIADPADPDDVAATQQMLARFAELQQRIEAAFEPWLAVAPAITAVPEA
jgi:V/A-type H+-transporting ATPase subunit A